MRATKKVSVRKLSKPGKRGRGKETEPCPAVHFCKPENLNPCTKNLYCDETNHGGDCGAGNVYACGGWLGKRGVNLDLAALIKKAMKEKVKPKRTAKRTTTSRARKKR